MLLLLYSCCIAWEQCAAFPRCSVWWGRESLNSQLPSLATCGSHWQIKELTFRAVCTETGRVPRPVPFQTFPRMLKRSNHLKTMVRTGGVFQYWFWKVLLKGLTDCLWTYQITHWTLSRIVNSEISTFLSIMKGGVYCLSKQSKCEINSILYYKNAIHGNCVTFYSKSNLNGDSYFISTFTSPKIQLCDYIERKNNVQRQVHFTLLAAITKNCKTWNRKNTLETHSSRKSKGSHAVLRPILGAIRILMFPSYQRHAEASQFVNR